MWRADYKGDGRAVFAVWDKRGLRGVLACGKSVDKAGGRNSADPRGTGLRVSGLIMSLWTAGLLLNRWSIECFFKASKPFLKLGTEFQSLMALFVERFSASIIIPR